MLNIKKPGDNFVTVNSPWDLVNSTDESIDLVSAKGTKVYIPGETGTSYIESLITFKCNKNKEVTKVSLLIQINNPSGNHTMLEEVKLDPKMFNLCFHEVRTTE
jgi:hypothetical protein